MHAWKLPFLPERFAIREHFFATVENPAMSAPPPTTAAPITVASTVAPERLLHARLEGPLPATPARPSCGGELLPPRSPAAASAAALLSSSRHGVIPLEDGDVASRHGLSPPDLLDQVLQSTSHRGGWRLPESVATPPIRGAVPRSVCFSPTSRRDP